MRPDEGGAPAFDVRRAVLVGAVTALIMTVATVAAWVCNGDVPRGARVLGADLGGRSRADAENTLRERVAARASTPVLVRLDGRDLRLDPASIGVRIDVELSVGRAIRGPVLVRGHRDVPPVVDVDKVALGAALCTAMSGADRGGSWRVAAYQQKAFDLDLVVRRIKRDWPLGLTATVPLEPAAADLLRLGG